MEVGKGVRAGQPQGSDHNAVLFGIYINLEDDREGMIKKLADIANQDKNWDATSTCPK